ncbi:MAG: preprotein translocase subunit SecG [Alphaproteobacteria bacterium]|nr:preprotein translocase subunit SecG [Alphaproteobacteria bacterium]
MEHVLLVIHLFLAMAIIGLVLLQRSEGGGLGIGGGGGLGGLATPQGTANMLSRATAICAAAFFTTSLLLGIWAGRQGTSQTNLMDALQDTPPAIAGAPLAEEPAPADEPPSVPPDVPIAE